jgi:hypothetical protein
MSTKAYASPAGVAAGLSAPQFPIRRYARTIMTGVATRVATWVATWATARANAIAAAAVYEHLSKLSDAELHRRGLSRSTLACDVSRTFG